MNSTRPVDPTAGRDRPSRAVYLASLFALLPVLGLAQVADAPAATEETEKDRETAAARSEIIELPSFQVTQDRESTDINAPDATATSRIKTSILETPQAISVITPELLKRVAPTKVFDVVAYTAGVSEGTSAGYFQNRVSIRGFPSAVPPFVDGISGSNFDLAQVERIEVLKGPNAVLAPTGIPGGTINIVTKSPQFHHAGSFAVTLGQFDAQRATFDLTGPVRWKGEDSKTWAFRIVASGQDTERFQQHTRRKQWVFLPSLTWKNATTTATLKWNYYYSDPTHESRHPIYWNAGSNDEAVPYPGIPRDAYFSEPSLQRTSKTTQPTLTINTQLSDHIAMRVFAVYTEDIVDHETYTDNIAAPAGGAVNPRTGLFTPGIVYGPGPDFLPSPAAVPNITNIARNGSGLDVHNRRGLIQNDFVAVYALPHGVKSTTIAGWSYTRTSLWEIDLFGSTTNINLLAPVIGNPITLSAPTTNRTNRGRTDNAFIMERLEAFGGRLHLTGGLQWLRDRNMGVNQLNNTSLLTDVETTTKLYSALWKLNDITSVYYSYNENAAPVNSGLGAAPIIFQAGVQDEIGLKWEPMGRRLRVSLAAYKISQSNFSFTNPARIADPTAPQFLFTDLKSNGYEFEVSGAVTKRWNIMGNYSYAHIKDQWGRPQRGAPRHSAAFYTNYRWTEGRLKSLVAGIGVNYQGRRPGDNATGFTALQVPIQPTFYLAAYTILKANLDYTWRKVDFQLSVDNLLDKTYIQSALTRNGAFMGSPRNIQLTTTYRF